MAGVASHTFMINSEAVGKDAMWTSDGSFMAVDEYGRGRVMLDFACYSCHKDAADDVETNPGAPFSYRSLDDLSIKATGIHTP